MKLSYAAYFDKVYGGWIGKCLGGAAGGPVEGIKARIYKKMEEIYNPKLPNDDLDIQLLWLDLLERKGSSLTACEMAQGWLEHCWYPFGEYGVFLRNYMRGIKPPYTGGFNNSYFKDGMGCPIRSEIWAMIYPGEPQKALHFAQMDGSLDHDGESVYAEMFLARMQSQAFFENDVQKLITDSSKEIPESKLKCCIESILQAFETGVAFEKTVDLIIKDYSHPDFTNVVQNLGFIVASLLYGEGDMEKVINLAIYCGYDVDCTCASAGALIGIIKGYSGLDHKLLELLSDQFVCGIDVHRRDNTIKSLAEDTCRVGISLSEWITDLPETVKPLVFESKKQDFTITVDYCGEPAISPEKPCTITITVKNASNRKIKAFLEFSELPNGFGIVCDSQVELEAGTEIVKQAVISVRKDTESFAQKNIIKVQLVADKVLAQQKFGVIGCVVYKVAGPFIEPLQIPADPELPRCHGEGCELPSCDEIFSNQALLSSEYIDEKRFVENAEEFDFCRYVYATEDIIPIDQAFGVFGEATFYLATDIVFDSDVEAFALCGNTDAYKLWVNGELVQEFDEKRIWQPQAHGSICKFKKGKNRIVFKVCRRGYQVSQSFAIRKYEGQHFHRTKYLVDYSSSVVK